MKHLVFGARGFIGQWLMKELENAMGVDKDECDVTNKEEVRKVISEYEPEVIINLAGIANPAYCEENYARTYKVNVDGARNILDAWWQAKKIILMSSAQVYEASNHAIKEESKITEKYTPYTIQKKEMELTTMDYENAIIIRPFNQEGPGRSEEYYTSQIMKAMITGEEYELWNPNEVRDMLDVRDCARGIKTIADYGECSEVYNLSSGWGISKLAYIKIVELMLDEKLKYVITRDENRERRIGDNTKIRSLGWKPAHTLEDTIKAQWKWLKDKKEV